MYNDVNMYSKAERTGVLGTSLAVLMRKVYLWMTLALVVTGITSYGVATTPALAEMVLSNSLGMWGLIIAEICLVLYISARINRISLATGTMLFILYAVLNGATLSVIFFAFSLGSIGTVFMITAGTFAVMAFIGYTTKTDLSSVGKLLFMALIGIIIATVVNIFLGSSMLSMIISYVGVIVFVGLTAWDTQKIKVMLAQCEYPDENAQKLALVGALSLYLDFINLFLYLLRIFGDRR